ncbi:hypothetical protein AYM40_05735 [Paraburkholderia phytofirmans OLGA172]|uniref:Arc-like DNA binding domain-containing protein n=1 Tax=Paraburkholderia phytofirmans OLGA172 TaxID=1417228 RepID=A0A160FI73_9BURK|nr:Arc family DNA-binding protein [Paraburkholderia phytofirmans]ANB71929.1 hypothetical protein AYM40_05735 [Paraburkholderia phytofirmans OLGA172]
MMQKEKLVAKQPSAYPLRMPPELREALQASADAAGHSLNNEIVARLEKSIGPPPKIPKGLEDIIKAASTDINESVEEAALRLVVAGIRSEDFRRSVQAKDAAGRYREIAVHELLISTSEKLAELAHYVGQVPAADRERAAAAIRHSDAVRRYVRQLDLFRSMDG